MNYKTILTIATAGAVLSLYASVPAPQVSAVSMVQNANGEAIINYSLSAANAVITLDIQTNATGSAWVSIGGEAVSSACGDVWKVVTTGSHRIKWNGVSCWADNKIPASGIRAVVTAWALDNTPDYMVVDVSSSAQPNTQRYYPAADFLPGGLLANDDYRTTKLVMRKIMAKGVEWTMGSTTLETQRNSGREATHLVTLTNNYYIGVFEVTQAQWALIQTSNPSPSQFTNPEFRAMRPVEHVCYNEIRISENVSSVSTDSDMFRNYSWPKDANPASFLGNLRRKTGIEDFDLPGEAQWEFAARAGNGVTKWGDGSGILNSSSDANLGKLGRYERNGGKINDDSSYVEPDHTCGAENGTAIVGSYTPNDWGLYDMHGNVWEWCLDWHMADISGFDGRVNINPSDPANPISGTSDGYRVIRGGDWSSAADQSRPACRSKSTPNTRGDHIGFRVVCTAGLQ